MELKFSVLECVETASSSAKCLVQEEEEKEENVSHAPVIASGADVAPLFAIKIFLNVITGVGAHACYCFSLSCYEKVFAMNLGADLTVARDALDGFIKLYGTANVGRKRF